MLVDNQVTLAGIGLISGFPAQYGVEVTFGGLAMQAAEQYHFVRLVLASESLSFECRQALEELGVECLEDGAPGEAYGIVTGNYFDSSAASRLGEVQSVAFDEPPCGK